MERENATNDRAFEAEVRDLPAGESAGPGGAYQVEIDKRTGEARFAVDLDGVRYWLIVPPDGRIEDAIAEVQRRTRHARSRLLDPSEGAIDALATRLAAKLQAGIAPVRSHEVATQAAAAAQSPSEHAPRTAPKRRMRHRSLVGTEPVPPDAFIDQWSDLVPHDVFLRLAAERRFPTTREGHRILARWGDVRDAVKVPEPTPPAEPYDPLNEIRAKVGLRPKGGR
jgi:hypothetical protein